VAVSLAQLFEDTGDDCILRAQSELITRHYQIAFPVLTCNRHATYGVEAKAAERAGIYAHG
jgi:hypothetical protein